ncbi:competence/damage-inducible protein A [Gilvibacter sp.]|jgi:nicotinamide-nucleotide amidase|uniref:competence/damage-inducible protein A n=1 Tax=Gilvibacter sp. TaxID=2729997 RepID=UPI003B521C4C
MQAEIITIGDEILIGQIVDTNSAYIATELNKIGIQVYQITSVQDERHHILDALAKAKARSQVVIVTGGLGPTKDDITKQTFCEFFKDELVENEDVIRQIHELFATYVKRKPLPANLTQALVPSKAEVLPNQHGTAPGMWMQQDGVVFVSLPGVPYEMKGLMQDSVLPKLQETFDRPFIFHKTLLTYGEGESSIANRIEAWEDALPAHIKLAYLPSLGRVRLRLSAKGKDKDQVIADVEAQIKALMPMVEHIFVGFEEDGAIEEAVAKLLTDMGKTLSIAESCTGGRIAQTFISRSGASAYFKGGITPYETHMKVKLLGVPQELIDKHSVVSAEVAASMATQVKQLFGSDYAISTTGNAGPSLGDSAAPVGTVFIGIAGPEGVITEEHRFGKHRDKVIQRATNKALELLRKQLIKSS